MDLLQYFKENQVTLAEGKYQGTHSYFDILKKFQKSDLKGFTKYFWWTINSSTEIVQTDTKGYFYVLQGKPNSGKTSFL